jgi:membrane associated rhomboid family serine protease
VRSTVTSTATGLAYWLAYVASWLAVKRTLEARGTRPRPTRAAVVLWLAVAVSSVVGLVWPVWLAVGEREPGPVRDGQVWRLVTSMFLQDGGVGGTIFNVVTLAVTVLLVGSLVRPRTLVVGFLLAGVVGNVLTLVLLGQAGAGNSMATMGLASGTAAYAALALDRSRATRVLVGVVALVALGLDLAGDQHGPALTAGLAAGCALALLARRPGTRSTAA